MSETWLLNYLTDIACIFKLVKKAGIKIANLIKCTHIKIKFKNKKHFMINVYLRSLKLINLLN